MALQNSSANRIDEHINSQIEQTGDSHTVPADHIAEGTEGLERTENVDQEGKKIDEDTVDFDQKGASEMDVNSDAGIDARGEVAIVAKFADESEQRKAGVDAWSEVATHVDYGFDESVASARRKFAASNSVPIKLCQHKKCKGTCVMRFNKPRDDKKRKKEKGKTHGLCNSMDKNVSRVRNLRLHDLLGEVPLKVANDTRFANRDANSDGVAMQFEAKEVKQKTGFWRRLLERVSCFGHNQRYEDKDSRIIFNIETIDNEINYLVDEKNTTTTNNSDIITANNHIF